jgi:hypothetical protein
MAKNKNMVNATLKREAKKRQKRAAETQQKLNDAAQREIAPDLDNQHTILNPAHPDDAPLTIDELASLGLQLSPTRISSQNSRYGVPVALCLLLTLDSLEMEHDLSAPHDTGDVLHSGSDKLAFPINSIPSLP